jgi:hypothetical protein
LPLRLDNTAESADEQLPAFLARPEGAPAYYGFPLVDGAEIDGWKLGMISDFLAEPGTYGDAYVVAPDGSRAGLVWEAEVAEPYIREVMPPDSKRWGVWAIGLREPMRTADQARTYLIAAIPLLTPKWESSTSA